MTSNMLAGERRWASARRSGMTVLGKVAVPKPLNLPSQRLENHGLDPSVEIVPKGTLSWGSRSSSSASNAWGSSTLSPNTDGGTTSPSHLSGRPSSGGSATRPSTAGSDKTNEPSPNAGGPNSRPSSASGLPSNQTSSTSLRPRSADTRPGSSQLSRFAEPASDHSAAWGSSGATDRLGVLSSRSAGFSLSSGDFPTLGADSSVKNSEIHDGLHGRPSSASGGLSQTKGNTSQADTKSGPNGMWKRDPLSNTDEGVQPNTQNLQEESRPYFNANVPPQHFEAWHGPPINAPPSVWYRGPPGGPPFRGPVPPTGFPIEPFSYYHPQVPPALANSQPGPPPGPGPRGHHLKNGDLYRPPQVPEAYAHPGMPFRPGFYPGPMPFEGYYRPPMGYCNSSDQEIPFIGMAGGPPAFNRYSGPNPPDPSNIHVRGTVPATGRTLPDHLDSANPDERSRSYKVLSNKHNEGDKKEEGNSCGSNLRSNSAKPECSRQPGSLSLKNELGTVDKEDVYPRKAAPNKNSTSRHSDDHGSYPSEYVKVLSSRNKGDIKGVDGSWRKKSEEMQSTHTEVPHLSAATERDFSLPAAVKDSTLIQKIEGLNAKARASDVHHDDPFTSNKEVQKKRPYVNSDFSIAMNEAGYAAVSTERNHASGNPVPAPEDQSIPDADKRQITTALPRRPYHGVHGRSDSHGKGNFRRQNGEDGDRWQKKPVHSELHAASAVLSSDSLAHNSLEVKRAETEKSIPKPAATSDSQVQNISESKRDIKEYIPKPMAKELAQQGSYQQQESSPVSSDVVTGRSEPAPGSPGGVQPFSSETEVHVSTLEAKDRDNKFSKHGKAHGAWRKRAEPAYAKEVRRGPSLASETRKNSHEPTEGNPHLNPELNSEKSESKGSDELKASDDSNTHEFVAASAASPAVREEVLTGKGKRHFSKEQRGMGSGHDHDNKTSNSFRKRAEMERYIPKPVAKELAQQGTANQPVPLPVGPPISDESAGQQKVGSGVTQPVSSTIDNHGSIEDSGDLDSKYNKQGKPHGAWRKRVSTEPPHGKEVHFGSSSTSDANRNGQESVDQNRLVNHRIVTAKSESKSPDESKNMKSGTDSGSSVTSHVTSPVTKDEVIPGRGKRNFPKGNKSMGSSYDSDGKNTVRSGEAHKLGFWSEAVDVNQMDRTAAVKDIHSTGKRLPSHWQANSYVHSASDQQKDLPNEGQNVAVESGGVVQKDNNPQQGKVNVPPQPIKNSDQLASDNKNVVEVPKDKETRRERNVAPHGGRPYSPNQGPAYGDELAPASNQDDRSFSSGFRRKGSQNHPGGGHDSRGNWSSGQDNRKHNISANWDRRRNNMHYEYQPVGQYSKPDQFEGQADDSHDSGPRYREKGHIHSKRGGGKFQGRQGGGAKADTRSN